MEIIGTVELQDEPVGLVARLVSRDGTIRDMQDAIQTETLLSVYVNDILTMKLACSASHLVDLVVGRLFTEGMIDSVDEIDALSICENSMRADVILRDRAADFTREGVEITPTCCTNNTVVNRYFARDLDLEPVVPIAWTPDQVFRICDEFALDKTAHSRTRGAHSAYLCSLAETLCVREDIGRHNAFDKAVGWALANDVDLSQCMLYTSGRVPTDMVVKAIRARLPLLISKAVATDKTVDLVRRYDLTLICEGKEGSFAVLNDPAGVLDGHAFSPENTPFEPAECQAPASSW